MTPIPSPIHNRPKQAVPVPANVLVFESTYGQVYLRSTKAYVPTPPYQLHTTPYGDVDVLDALDRLVGWACVYREFAYKHKDGPAYQWLIEFMCVRYNATYRQIIKKEKL